MNTIEHTIEIRATPAAIRDAVTSQAGLRSWWTTDTDVAGDRITLRFEKAHGVMEVDFAVTASSDSRVELACVGERNNPDWLATTLSFALGAAGNATRVGLAHSGFRARNEVFDMCTKGWAFFLASLKSYLEGEAGTPHIRPIKTRSIVDAVDIAAPAARVLAAVATPQGVAGWWTAQNEIAGDQYTVRFGSGEGQVSSTFRVERRDDRGLAMVCVDDHGMGWLGTRLAFAIEGDSGRTHVALTHSGFTATAECYDGCIKGWNHFLASLRSYLETGSGAPMAIGSTRCE